MLTDENLHTKGTPVCHGLLQNKLLFTKLNPHLQWEHDISALFRDFQWLAALNVTLKASKYSNLLELTHKRTLRWYETLHVFQEINSSVSPLCWKGYGSIGNIYYIFWSSGKLSTYWLDVFHLIHAIINLQINSSPELSLQNIENIHSPLKYILLHSLLAARLVIARHWQSTFTPTKPEVKALTHSHGIDKHLFASSKDCLHTAQIKWSMWLSWFVKQNYVD